MPNPKSSDEAKAWIRAGLATVYHHIAFGYSVPLFWYVPDGSRREPVLHQGTAFFVDFGQGLFAITAHHVLEGYRRDALAGPITCQLGQVVIEPDDLIIDEDPAHDIVTLKVSAEDISASGRSAYTHVGGWPLVLPPPGSGVFFGGYRRKDLIETPSHTSFGFMGAVTPADVVDNNSIRLAFDRSRWIYPEGVPPLEPGESWGGASGGPVLSVIVGPTIDYWSLSAVLVEHNALDIFRASGLGHLKRDGKFDRA